MADSINDQEYAFGSGYVYGLNNVADDLHTQAHAEFEKKGNGDARGMAFFELYKTLKEMAANVQADLDARYQSND